MAMSSDHDLHRLSISVGRHLLERGLFLTTAESCTGGWVAKAVTDIAGSSQWFTEGWVTYSNEAKRSHLGVAAGVLKRHGAVSEAVVSAMARGALRRAGAQVAVAVSGIAGPGGAVPGKPVGTVWFAWVLRAGARTQVRTMCKQFRGGRDVVRSSAVRYALRGVIQCSTAASTV